MLSLTSNVDIPTISGEHGILIEWENTEYDVGNWVEGPTASGLQFRVPADVNYVILQLTVLWDDSSGGDRGLGALKNGEDHPGMAAVHADAGSNLVQLAHSAAIPVVEGDRFEANAEHHGGGTKEVIADNKTYFSIHRVG
jgi:hypothetical protein